MKTLYLRLCLAVIASTAIFYFSCTRTKIPDTQLGNWVQAAAIDAYPRSNSVCFTIGDRAYVGTGYNETIGGAGRLVDFWTFSVDSGWTQIQDFPGAPRSNAAAFSIGNYGYVGTGYDGYTLFKDFWQYDPVQNQWTRKADYIGGPRYDAVGFGIQGKGYIGTGYSNYWLNDFYSYDPAQDKWSVTPGTSGNFTKRRAAIALVYQDKAYIVTGSNSGGLVKDFWRFDPSQPPAWHRLSDIANDSSATFDDGYSDIERVYATGFVNGSQAYLTTGQNGQNGSSISSTWAYDFPHDRWTRRTAWMRSARSGAVSFTVSGSSFVGAGMSGTQTLDDFDLFEPNVGFNSNDY